MPQAEVLMPPLRRPTYFRGLPRLANEIPPASAALRNSPAFFKASVFSCPHGMARAASKASSASASLSRVDRSPAMGCALNRLPTHRSLDFISETIEVFVYALEHFALRSIRS